MATVHQQKEVMKNTNITKAVLLCAALAIGAGAHAKDKNNSNPSQQQNGPTIGNATADDVTLATENADKIAFSTVNPMQYGGNSSGFAGTFGTPASGAWNVLGTFDSAGKTDNSSLLDFSFSGAGTTGTWTVSNTSSTQNVVLDLTLAIHASNSSTAFLFDNQAIAAGQTLSGTWQIEWLNNGGQVPAFSNAVIFGGDMAVTNVSPVPEPAALPMVLAGFAVLGAAAWRRRQQM
jgi:hypothetical protein